MKRGLVLSVLALTLIVVGCGKKNNAPAVATPGACANSTLLGKYTGTFDGQADVLTLSSDCTGSTTYCGAIFTFESTTAANGAFNMKITKVTNTTNGNCFTTGDASFMYSAGASSASFDFGNGANYTK